MIWCSKKNRENYIILKNAFEQKKKKPGLKFNPGLALIRLRTTGLLGLFRLTFLLTAPCHQSLSLSKEDTLGTSPTCRP